MMKSIAIVTLGFCTLSSLSKCDKTYCDFQCISNSRAAFKENTNKLWKNIHQRPCPPGQICAPPYLEQSVAEYIAAKSGFTPGRICESSFSAAVVEGFRGLKEAEEGSEDLGLCSAMTTEFRKCIGNTQFSMNAGLAVFGFTFGGSVALLPADKRLEGACNDGIKAPETRKHYKADVESDFPTIKSLDLPVLRAVGTKSIRQITTKVSRTKPRSAKGKKAKADQLKLLATARKLAKEHSVQVESPDLTACESCAAGRPGGCKACKVACTKILGDCALYVDNSDTAEGDTVTAPKKCAAQDWEKGCNTAGCPGVYLCGVSNLNYSPYTTYADYCPCFRTCEVLGKQNGVVYYVCK